MPPIHYTLLVLLSLWTRIISAELACISPTSTPSVIHPGSPIALGSLDGESVSTLSDIAANLVCSSTRTVALTLGGGYDSVTITTAQAAAALASCPTNSFHVEYTATALAGQQVVVHCKDVVSIQTTRSPVAIDLGLPDIPLPLPIPGVTTTIPIVDPTPPTTPSPTTTTPAATTPVETTKPAETSSPAAGTKTKSSRPPKTTQTQQPSSLPGQGGGSNGGGSQTKPSGAPSGPQASPSNDSSISPSEMQTEKSTTSTTTIIAACGGILGGTLVILAAILVWRKREQRRQRVSFDQFYSESLAAASGFNDAENSSKNYKRDSNNSNGAGQRPAYSRPSDLEQGYDGYPAGPGSAPPMRQQQHAGYRGGPAPMPGGPGYGHGHGHGHEYEYA